MRVRGISWVGVKTDSYQQMRDFFADVAGLAVDHEQLDFAVFRLPNGDKLEIFGPGADDPPEQFAQEKVVASLLVDDMGPSRPVATAISGNTFALPTERSSSWSAIPAIRDPRVP
jgi:hypothetical protein